jgi:hypothetical protein
MHPRDLPDVALLHVVVFVDGSHPARVLAVSAEHGEFVPANLRRAAVRTKVYDRRERQQRAHFARREPFPASAELIPHPPADRCFPAHGALTDDHLRIVGEELRHLVPQTHLGELRVRDVQPAHVAKGRDVGRVLLQAGGALRHRGSIRPERRGGC